MKPGQVKPEIQTMNNYYVIEKLTDAMDAFITGRGDVRSRIKNAYSLMHTLRESDFPDTLKEDWVWIYGEITKRGPLLAPNGEVWLGDVDNTMRSIRNITGQRIARRISKLYWEISKNEKYS